MASLMFFGSVRLTRDGVDRKYACLTNQHDEPMSPLVLVPGCSDSRMRVDRKEMLLTVGTVSLDLMCDMNVSMECDSCQHRFLSSRRTQDDSVDKSLLQLDGRSFSHYYSLKAIDEVCRSLNEDRRRCHILNHTLGGRCYALQPLRQMDWELCLTVLAEEMDIKSVHKTCRRSFPSNHEHNTCRLPKSNFQIRITELTNGE
ncbi:hypothetical protein Tco_1185144 [Tanacetum coccineum]